MELAELLARLTTALETLEIPYLVTGSIATIAYGEPRFTNDLDVVVRLTMADIDRLAAVFPSDDYYLSSEAARDAIKHSTQFNILHPRSGLKIDVMVADSSSFNRSRFSRARVLAISPTAEATFAAPEDVIIKKLQYYREGGSEKHLRDITGVLKVLGDELDRVYIERWTTELGLHELWLVVVRAIDEERSD